MYFVLVVYESVNNSVHIKRNQKYRRRAVFFWLRNTGPCGLFSAAFSTL